MVLRMKPQKTVEEFLRWRLEQARAEAPPAPCASHLLALARPSGKNGQKSFIRRLKALAEYGLNTKGLGLK